MDKDTSSAASTASPTPSPAPAPVQPDNSIRVEGILDIDNSRNGALLDLAKHGKRRPTDPFVPRELIRRFHLNQGSMVTAMATYLTLAMALRNGRRLRTQQRHRFRRWPDQQCTWKNGSR